LSENLIVASSLQSRVLAKLTRRLLPFLFLLYVVAYLDRINVGFAKLQMSSQLHFSEAVYGLAAGMFFAGYFFFQVPSNLILARIGARRWIATIMLVWGSISAAMMLVNGARSFYILRFCLGLAEAGFFPGIILYLRSWFPSASRARAVALFMTAGPISGVIGGPLSGAILKFGHFGRLAAWQWLFLLEGIPAVLLGVLVLRVLADRPTRAHWLSAEEASWLDQTLQLEEKQVTNEGHRRNWWTVFADERIILLGFIYFCLNTSSYGLSLWLPSLLSGMTQRNTLTVGLLSAIPYLFAAVSMVLVGSHSDRSGERRWHVAGAATLAASAFLFAAFATSTLAAVAGLTVAMLGVFSMVGPFWAIPGVLLSDVRAPVGIAFINSIGNLGGFAGPYVLGLARTASGNFKSGLLILACTMIAASLLTLILRLPSQGALRHPMQNGGA
jgi:ACS family tartrate transporter-like MFS transporter